MAQNSIKIRSICTEFNQNLLCLEICDKKILFAEHACLKSLINANLSFSIVNSF